MTHIHPRAAVAALELAGRLTDEATSPRGIAYDVPLDHAQRRAAERGIDEPEIRAALDEVRRQRGA
jgi:hypothetical protein